MGWVWLLAVWFVATVPVGIVIGKTIKAMSGEAEFDEFREEAIDPPSEARASEHRVDTAPACPDRQSRACDRVHAGDSVE